LRNSGNIANRGSRTANPANFFAVYSDPHGLQALLELRHRYHAASYTIQSIATKPVDKIRNS
jgi:hypothetical protein